MAPCETSVLAQRGVRSSHGCGWQGAVAGVEIAARFGRCAICFGTLEMCIDRTLHERYTRMFGTGRVCLCLVFVYDLFMIVYDLVRPTGVAASTYVEVRGLSGSGHGQADPVNVDSDLSRVGSKDAPATISLSKKRTSGLPAPTLSSGSEACRSFGWRRPRSHLLAVG